MAGTVDWRGQLRIEEGLLRIQGQNSARKLDQTLVAEPVPLQGHPSAAFHRPSKVISSSALPHHTSPTFGMAPAGLTSLQLPQIGVISVNVARAPALKSPFGSLSARTFRSHEEESSRSISARRRKAETPKLCIQNSVEKGFERQDRQEGPARIRSQLVTPRARKEAQQRIDSKMSLMVHHFVPDFDSIKPPSSIRNRRTKQSEAGQSDDGSARSATTTSGSSRQNGSEPIAVWHEIITGGDSDFGAKTGTHSQGEDPEASMQMRFPTPPARFKAGWTEWNDPLFQSRKQQRFRSRIIKEASASNLRSILFESNPSFETPSGRTIPSQALFEQDEIDRELRNVDELLSEHPVSSRTQNRNGRSHLRARLEAPPTAARPTISNTSQLPTATLNVQSAVSEVPWNVPTLAERAYQLERERIEAGVTGVNATSLVSQQAEVFENRMAGILEATIDKVEWGKRGARASQGGLQELEAAMEAAREQIPSMVEKMERAAQLVTKLAGEKSKAMLLEGQAHAEATAVMASLYVNNFDGAAAAKEPDAPASMDEDGLDNLLEGLYLEAARNHMEEQPAAKAPAVEKTALDREGGGERRGGAREEGEMAVIHSADVMQHVDFHRDIAYIKYKTTVFKQTMRDRNLGPDVLDLSKQVVNPTMPHHLSDRKVHFLRICFMEADHLPVMDVLKKSKGDTYVRCSLFAGDRIVLGHKGEEIVTTRVAWNTKKPNWKDQEFEFIVPHTNEDVVLRVEVRDVDMSGYGQGSLDDHFIGELDFLILQEGTQVMVSELEYEEWYLLRNKDKSDVRHNLGVENSVLKGRGSVLRVRHIYTKKPRLSRSEYAKRLQGNLRCLFARKRFAEAKAERHAMLSRTSNTEEMEGRLITDRIWKDYTAECERQMTHPIRKIKDQLTTSEISLNMYVVSFNGIVALSQALNNAAALGRLRNLVLQNMEIRGRGVVELVNALNTHRNNLQLLKLDGNPLSMEPVPGSRDPNTNRLARGVTAAHAVAQLLDETPSLTCLSLSNTQLGDDGIAIIANAVGKHCFMSTLDLSNNNSKGDMLASASAVGQMLAESRSLMELDYSWNNLSLSAGLAFLGFHTSGQPTEGQGLSSNTSLRRLVVRSTALLKQLPCCLALAQTIGRAECALDFLDISSCNLSAQANIEAVASGVIANPALRILVLDGNKLGWGGYKAVMARRGRKRYVSSFQRKAEAAATHPSAKSLEAVMEIYRSFDEDESGTMDRGEFAQILVRLGFMKSGWTDKDANAVFDKIDVDASGEIDFNEFYEWYCEELMVGEDGESSMQVSMKNCSVNVKDANFDAADPDGTYDVDMSLMRSRTILLALMKLVYNGKGEFVDGTVFRSTPNAGVQGEYETTPFTIETPPDISSWVIPRVGYLSFDFRTALTKKQASVSINLDELLELRRQLEDVSLSRAQRQTLLDAHLTPGRLLSYHQALDLLKVYLLDTPELTGTLPTDKDHDTAPINFAPIAKSQPTSASATPEPGAEAARSTNDDLHMLTRRKSLIRQGSGRAKGIDRQERFDFVVRVFPILNQTERDLRILGHLEPRERKTLEARLGIAIHAFDARNPTGYQRLRLNKVGERGLVLRLIEMCNEMTREQEAFLSSHSHKTGGSKDPLSLVWRNARFNGRLFYFEKHWRVPHAGVLELDFVDVRKPDSDTTEQIPDTDYTALLAKVRSPFLSDRERVAAVRDATLEAHLSCLQVVGLLCELSLAQDAWRVELLVVLFPRIVDWRGYRSLLFYLPVTARDTLLQRLGKPLLFHDGASSAVGHWKLNLAASEDRFIMQELLHCAHQEPGSNILDCEYNGSAFEVPSTWLALVPREGWISFFYSRDQTVQDACCRHGAWRPSAQLPIRRASSTALPRAPSTGSAKNRGGTASPPAPSARNDLPAAAFPPLFVVPMLPESYEGGREGLSRTWVYIEKIRLVKENLQRRVRTLAAVFAALDDDAGGSLSRDEMSLGLTRNGVWLSPADMDMLLDMLDVDRSGEVDLAEFADFWENAPPLRLGDYKQESYWAARGIRGRRYEEAVPFYDIRAQYPTEEVKRYGLHKAAHAPYVNPE